MATLLLATWLVAGCATIFAGGPSTLEARSTPSGAHVTAIGISNGERMTGTTPTHFTLSKTSDYELTFELAGFVSETVMVRRTVNGWFFGNFLLGVVPMVIDAATSNMWSHTLQVASVDFANASRNPDGSFTAHVVVRTVSATDDAPAASARFPLRFVPNGA
ncbi:MAG: hypothetical protein WD336_01000 [Trueperaceae bacterium]